MSFLFGITFVFIMQIAGEVLARLTSLPLPGPLIGMLLLLVALIAYGRVPTGVGEACHYLLRHLMLLFIPLIAGIMLHFDSMQREWLPFLLACIGGVALTIVVTALTFSWMVKRGGAPRP